MKTFSVYIRPLQIEDAEISYKWRNNPKIWRFTGTRPDRLITHDIERDWLEKVLQRQEQKRFAICIQGTNLYIGNVFFTDIHDGSAIIHIFIGDIENWGRRRALEAMALLLAYGFEELNLNEVYGLIDKKNFMSNALAKSFHCIPVAHFTDQITNKEMIKWLFNRSMFEKGILSDALHSKALSKGI